MIPGTMMIPGAAPLRARTSSARTSGCALQPERRECVVHRRVDRHRDRTLQNPKESLDRPSAHKGPRMSVLASADVQFVEDPQARSTEELHGGQVQHNACAFEVTTREVTQRRCIADVDLTPDGDMKQIGIHPMSRETGSG